MTNPSIDTPSNPYLLGQGILSWDGQERRSKRYGTINLTSTNYKEDSSAKMWLNASHLSMLFGLKVHLYCCVVEDRDSGHVGDLNLRIKPSRPQIGEQISLGVGNLFSEENDVGTAIGLKPSDGRACFWFDPRALYRLHDQTVQLFCFQTDEPPHTVQPFDSTGKEVELGADERGTFLQITDPIGAPPAVGVETELQFTPIEGGFITQPLYRVVRKS